MDWDGIAGDYLAVAHEVINGLRPAVETVADDMLRRVRAGNKILFCGNGGSAADAQHFAAELVNRFLLEREPMAGLSLTTDSSALTSISNDYGFDEVFARQVLGLGRPGDLLVVISTSGNSANLLRAVEAARARRMDTLGLLGGTGGALLPLVDRALCVSSTTHTPRIQEGHHFLMHLICERVEAQWTSRRTPDPGDDTA
jgi:D-sedoheptulose 7-phosphate isomerase